MYWQFSDQHPEIRPISLNSEDEPVNLVPFKIELGKFQGASQILDELVVLDVHRLG
jgi:hypothetical protein